jgi:hypothetical protein
MAGDTTALTGCSCSLWSSLQKGVFPFIKVLDTRNWIVEEVKAGLMLFLRRLFHAFRFPISFIKREERDVLAFPCVSGVDAVFESLDSLLFGQFFKTLYSELPAYGELVA